MAFRPDIVVTGPDGVMLVVEVKTSLPNLQHSEEQLKRYMIGMQCPTGVLVTPERMWVYRRQPYSAFGGKLAMKHPAAETLKQQIPLLDYVKGQDWKPIRRIARGRLMGLCRLHADRKPSFLLDPNKTCSTAMAAPVAVM
jgi:hypothetical protein